MTLSLPQSDWEDAASRIAHTDGPVAWSWLAVPSQGSTGAGQWQIAVLTIRGATKTKARFDKYPGLWISTERLSAKEAARRFREGSTAGPGRPSISFGPIASGASTFWHTTEPSGLRTMMFDWPRYVADFHLQVQVNQMLGRWEPLTASGQPYHANAQAAIAELLYGVPPEAIGNDLSSRIQVVLPDLRARFGHLQFNNGVALVDIQEGRKGGCKGLRLRAKWREELADAEWRGADLALSQPGTVQIPTTLIPVAMSMAITDRSGQVLDHRGWTPETQNQPEDTTISPQQVERWIADGESQTVELKEGLPTESVRLSLAKTVAAFANGDGGNVVIGVTDDYEVVGYDPDTSVLDQVRNIIDSRVAEPPEFKVLRIPIGEKAVYVVSVLASPPERRPHVVGGVAYFRATSRTRAAFPGEIRRMLVTQALRSPW